MEGWFLLNKKNNIITLTKNLTNGYSKIEYNKFFIDSINILQQKEYKINKFYLNFIKTSLFQINNDILSDDRLKNLYEELESCKKKVDEKKIYDYLQEYKSLTASNKYKNKEIEKKKKLINELKLFFKIEDDDINKYNKWLESYKVYYKFYNNNIQYNYILNICNILQEYTLYIPNKTDFRGRFYPIGRLLHRASGNYKYLLLDIKDYTDFTNENMHILLIEYIVMLYKPFNEFIKNDLYNWFQEKIIKFLQESKISYFEIYDFLHNFILNKNDIQIDFINNNNNYTKNYINYFFTLFREASTQNMFIIALYEYFKIKLNISNISYLNVDLDQSSSGLMIYSILSKDLEMARLTNLLSSNKRNDLYNHFLNKFNTNLENINSIFKNSIIFKRNNFAKLLLMPIFYNMGDRGIKKLISNILKTNNLFIKKNEYDKRKELIKNIVLYINDILEKNYTKTIKFQKNLVKICKILYEKNIPISFYTLDGTYVQYKYIQLDYKYGFLKKSKFEKKKTYKILLPIDKDNKLDNKHYLTFPPNFIQSIDGALCRIIINVFYKITNVILEPLHDSFRIPFKYIKLLQSVIKYCYIFVFFNKYFFKYEIGLNLLNEEIEKNSLNFNNYKDYFYYDITKFKYNIIYDYFINTLAIDLETKNLIKEIFDEHIYSEEFSDNEIDKILKSDFMFYF